MTERTSTPDPATTPADDAPATRPAGPATSPRAGRRTRANGEESRRRILTAAVEVAGERGYEGTSISQVSKRSGLPASSIYWHFADKDALMAAVIESSFADWLERVTTTEGDTLEERVAVFSANVARSFRDSPDFLRLGMMLVLEQRPREPAAREMYVRTRRLATERIAEEIAAFRPDLDPGAAHRIATYALSGADGLFLALASDAPGADVDGLFALHAAAVLHLIDSA